MLEHRLILALLLGVPATAGVSVSPTIVQAAEECRMKPGSTAPSGSRWLYRINRTDHRHCWFLSSKAVGAHSQVSRRYRLLAGDPDAASQDEQRDSDLQATSAPTNKTDDVAAKPPVAPQATMPAIEQSSENLVSHSVLTIVYRPPPPTAQTALEPTVGAARAQSRTPAGGGKSNVVLLAGAAAAGLLLAGGVLHFTRRVHRRAHTQVVADRRSARWPLANKPLVEAMPLHMTAEYLKQSLHELKRDRQRAREDLLLLDQTHEYTAVSLPHAAAWLSRPKATQTVKAVNRQLADA
jgi:hypothetical protein